MLFLHGPKLAIADAKLSYRLVESDSGIERSEVLSGPDENTSHREGLLVESILIMEKSCE